MSSDSPNEKIVPFFFGQDSSLYGCLHLAADYERSPAMLICQPTSHEYERCHRAMRQLAVQSAKKGLSAMRFDYLSTGDSAGICEELSLSGMRQDIQRAVDCCREKTGVDHLTLVGLRLGATVALQLTHTCSAIDSLVLYAPVFDGERLLTEWQADQHTFIAKHSHFTQQAGPEEVLGFSVADKFQQELRKNFKPQIPDAALKRVLALVDEKELDSPLLKEWMQMFELRDIEVTLEAVENIAIWRREPMEAIVPIKTIRKIVKWITSD
jgi:alpha/beta superfamily hydrolase